MRAEDLIDEFLEANGLDEPDPEHAFITFL